MNTYILHHCRQVVKNTTDRRSTNANCISKPGNARARRTSLENIPRRLCAIPYNINIMIEFIIYY